MKLNKEQKKLLLENLEYAYNCLDFSDTLEYDADFRHIFKEISKIKVTE